MGGGSEVVERGQWLFDEHGGSGGGWWIDQWHQVGGSASLPEGISSDQGLSTEIN